jgi:hypothetical protein
MSRDHNDIYSIVDRLRVLEEGLDKNQRSVNQLSATFKPKTVAVLTAKKDPKNPMAGKLVGSDESVERKEAVLEADVAEDVLEKVKSSFKDFIKQAEEQIKDTDIKEKKKEDTDLKSREKQDRDLIVKAVPVAEDPTQMAPVKTMTTECGMYEMHGNERDGFEIRRGGRCLPTRFKDLAEAEMAIEMFLARQRQQDESQDYLDEE